MRFEGTSAYVATQDLKVAVNAAIALERPLLVKGEPGTGKTVLADRDRQSARRAADRVAHQIDHQGACRASTNTTRSARLRDGQLGDERVQDIRNYIKRGKLWDAFVSDERPVLLIDEIDKADIEFPNDLLQELDRMEFFVYETSETVQRAAPPDRRHHLEQREGTARRLSAPLLLPLHPLSRPRYDAGDHRRAFPRHQEAARRRSA